MTTEERTTHAGGAEAGPRTRTRRVSRWRRLRRSIAPRERIYQLLLLAVILGVWEIAGRNSPSFTFAPPSSMVPAARDMLADGELQEAAGESVAALLLGFAAAVVVGMALGYAMGWWRALGRTLDPFVTALYVLPIAALVPLIIVWYGLGLTSRVIVVFLFALFEILLSAYAGVKNVEPAIVDVARTFGANRRDLLRKAVFPASLPFLFVGLRMGAVRSVKGMVLAEMLLAATGLGGLIVTYAAAFRMDRVLVVIVAIVLIGMLLSGLVQLAERWFMRWRQDPRGATA